MGAHGSQARFAPQHFVLQCTPCCHSAADPPLDDNKVCTGRGLRIRRGRRLDLQTSSYPCIVQDSGRRRSLAPRGSSASPKACQRDAFPLTGGSTPALVQETIEGLPLPKPEAATGIATTSRQLQYMRWCKAIASGSRAAVLRQNSIRCAPIVDIALPRNRGHCGQPMSIYLITSGLSPVKSHLAARGSCEIPERGWRGARLGNVLRTATLPMDRPFERLWCGSLHDRHFNSPAYRQ